MSSNKANNGRYKRPARPKNAASLLIYRQNRGQYEVLMGRRGSSAPFKPGVYVFPGGIMEKTDFQVQPISGLPSGVTQHLAVAHSYPFANALAMTAIRETFEETGLLFGSPGKTIERVNHRSWNIFKEKKYVPIFDL